jgi:hypothetical protein
MWPQGAAYQAYDMSESSENASAASNRAYNMVESPRIFYFAANEAPAAAMQPLSLCGDSATGRLPYGWVPGGWVGKEEIPLW